MCTGFPVIPRGSPFHRRKVRDRARTLLQFGKCDRFETLVFESCMKSVRCKCLINRHRAQTANAAAIHLLLRLGGVPVSCSSCNFLNRLSLLHESYKQTTVGARAGASLSLHASCETHLEQPLRRSGKTFTLASKALWTTEKACKQSCSSGTSFSVWFAAAADAMRSCIYVGFRGLGVVVLERATSLGCW